MRCSEASRGNGAIWQKTDLYDYDHEFFKKNTQIHIL